jgi:hypothetical protein
MDFIHVSAQYSNAVLVALLPYISDFAGKLHLPILTPVTPAHVLEFRCDPRRGEVGGLVILTNEFRFAFQSGHVSAFYSPKSYFTLEDPDAIPRFFGPIKINQKEAETAARKAIQALGYNASEFRTDTKPKVDLPEKFGTNRVARYRFRWLDPEFAGKRVMGGILPSLLDIEVDASTAEIQRLWMSSRVAKRPGPVISVPEQELPKAPKEEPSKLVGGIKNEPVSQEYASAFLQAILPQVSDFAKTAGLPFKLPLSTNDVDLPRYYCGLLEGKPTAQIYLKNGDRVNYQHGRVVAYYAHDAYIKFPENGKMEDFIGNVRIKPADAISMCERIMKSLGYRLKLPKVSYDGPRYVAGRQFSRYVFAWWKPELGGELACIEVDAETKLIKSFYFDDPSLWREPPKSN